MYGEGMAKNPSSVSVVCPCGTTFERLIQRGRPAIWCPPCREIPMASRTNVPVKAPATAVVAGDTVVIEPAVRAVSRFGDNDTLTAAERDAVEERVAQVNAEYPQVYADRHKLFPGPLELDYTAQAGAWLQRELTDAYKAVSPRWWTAS